MIQNSRHFASTSAPHLQYLPSPCLLAWFLTSPVILIFAPLLDRWDRWLVSIWSFSLIFCLWTLCLGVVLKEFRVLFVSYPASWSMSLQGFASISDIYLGTFLVIVASNKSSFSFTLCEILIINMLLLWSWPIVPRFLFSNVIYVFWEGGDSDLLVHLGSPDAHSSWNWTRQSQKHGAQSRSAMEIAGS